MDEVYTQGFVVEVPEGMGWELENLLQGDGDSFAGMNKEEVEFYVADSLAIGVTRVFVYKEIDDTASEVQEHEPPHE